MASKIFPNIFDGHSVLLGLSPGHLASKFEEAQLIDHEIKKLKEVTAVYPKAELLEFRLMSLHAAKQKKLEKGDLSDKDLALPQVDVDLPRFSDDATPLSDIERDRGWYLRIYVLRMPSIAEQGPNNNNDAVVLREIYPPDSMEKTRITITYCRPWSSGLSLSDNRDLANTLSQLRSQLCNICRKKPREDTSAYRLPNCLLFLHFYDETEQFEDRSSASRLPYIPFCMVLKAGSITDDHKNILDESTLHNCSVPDSMFEELFKKQMLGSGWVDSRDLQNVYKYLKAGMPERVGFIIHIQLYKKDLLSQQ